jgi:enterochelin esterase family protein
MTRRLLAEMSGETFVLVRTAKLLEIKTSMDNPFKKTKVASAGETRPEAIGEQLRELVVNQRELVAKVQNIKAEGLAELTRQLDAVFSEANAMQTIESQALRNRRSIWIYGPVKGETVSNLVIFLDGELFLKHLDALALIHRLSAECELAGSLFVFVSMHSQAARLRECSCDPQFSRFIAVELIKFLEASYPELKEVPQRVLAGVSFSGLAAVFAAKEFSGVFPKVIAQSGSFWWKDCWLIKQLSTVTKPLPSAFYLDVGTGETEVDVEGDPTEDTFQSTSQIDSVKQLRDVLASQGCRVNYVEFSGGHEAKAWAKTLPGALIWAVGKS